MNRGESLRTWIIVLALLIFAGVASAVVPLLIDQLFSGHESTEVERESMVITLDVENMLLGDELIKIPFLAENVHGFQLTVFQSFAILLGVTLAATGATGLLITVATVLLGKTVGSVYQDEDYRAAVSELDNKQNEMLKEWRQKQPTAEPPDPAKRAGWSGAVYSFLFLIIVWVTGLVISVSFFGETTWEIFGLEVEAATVINVILVLTTLVVIVLVTRSREPGALYSGETDYQPLNWNMIWVIISGLLIVGLGTGAAIALRAAG